MLEDLEIDIQQKKAVIEIGDLPVVTGFRRQLEQLFQNLITNSLKYSKTEDPPFIHNMARTDSRKGRPYHVITVKDNGICFEQRYADKIFKMFTRLHGNTEYSGTGVGLSIAKKVVDNHRGMIDVESAPGKGSVFHVWLPAE